jgi:hypothetical protein
VSQESPRLQKGDTLFKGELDIHLNADISFWNKDFSGYAKGYKDAADFIVNGAIQNDRSYTFNVAYLIFPVVFLYRQYIELCLKEVILLGTHLNGEKHGFPTHHRIDEIWKHARPYLEGVSPKGSRDELDALGVCIQEFCSLDPDGMAFRYPVDLEGKPHLPDWTVINLRNLGETIGKIGNLLDGVTEYMYVLRQEKGWLSTEY